MSFTHMLILGIIALIVIPPEKLPEVAREIARFISDLKNSADQIMGELKRDAVFKPEDILDKNIKQKLADLQKDLNQTMSIDPKKPSAETAPDQAAAPVVSATPSAGTSSAGGNDTNGNGQS